MRNTLTNEPQKPAPVALQPVVRHPLVIPFDDGKYAVIPMGITADDFDCLQKTLVLWREKMVIPEAAHECQNCLATPCMCAAIPAIKEMLQDA